MRHATGIIHALLDDYATTPYIMHVSVKHLCWKTKGPLVSLFPCNWEELESASCLLGTKYWVQRAWFIMLGRSPIAVVK